MIINYAKIRQNMVSCQLQPSGVIAPDILSAFGRVPREKFLPEKLQSGAYVDEDIFLPDGGFLMEPVILGRMLQAAAPAYEDIVLNIGDQTGYSSAILSGLVTTIVTLESHQGQLDQARRLWMSMDFSNIAITEGRSREGCPEQGPYSLIVMNGAVCEIPPALLEQLDFNGRLLCVERTDARRMGQIMLIEKDTSGVYSRRRLYDAGTPWLEGFAPRRKFAF